MQDGFSATRERVKATRLREGDSKVFFSEIRPLALLIKYLEKTGYEIEWVQPVIGDQPFDARLGYVHLDTVIEQKLEFVEAIDGYDDKLRMEVLNRDGHVSATGSVLNAGSKHKGRPKLAVRTESILRSDNLSKIYSLIEIALRKKVRKNYETGTCLIVIFDDHIPVPFKEEYKEPIQALAAGYACLSFSPFSRIVVLGQSGEVHADNIALSS